MAEKPPIKESLTTEIPQTVSAGNICNALGEVGILGTFCWDSTYALPSREWLTSFGSSYLAWRKRELTRPEYIPEQDDCDKFARDACDWASILHRNTMRLQARLAFGVVVYLPDSSGSHAINVAVVREDERLIPLFWEPQTQQIVALSENERASAQVWI